jgi:hypothetical protein
VLKGSVADKGVFTERWLWWKENTRAVNVGAGETSWFLAPLASGLIKMVE